MRRRPILIHRRRWLRMYMRVVGHEPGGIPIFAGKPKGYALRMPTSRHRTLQRRREENCVHAHLAGGLVSWEYGEYEYQCNDCGASCPDLGGRARVARRVPG